MKAFIINQPVSLEETRSIEFKEVKGTNPIDTIKNTCDEYVVAFLNRGGGSIFWGVRDHDRTVSGVVVNYKERDELRKEIINKICTIKPSISPGAYQINFHEVLNEQRDKIENCFVVEIVVPSPLEKALYSTGSNNVFIKTDSGKKKLTIPEIQDEILRRKQLGNDGLNSKNRNQSEGNSHGDSHSFEPKRGGINRILRMLFNFVILSSFVIAGSILFQKTNEKNFENATATANAKATEVANYAYYETFDNNSGGWQTKDENNSLFTGSLINNRGVYEININEPKIDGYFYIESPSAKPLSDFVAHIEAKRINGLPNTACYGLVFRLSQNKDKNKFYSFVACDDQDVRIKYYSDETAWVELKHLSGVSEFYPSDWDSPKFLNNYLRVYPGEWNALEVHAQGNKFRFFINNKMIAEISDSRLKEGRVGLLVTVNTKSSSSVWFDNYAIQEK